MKGSWKNVRMSSPEPFLSEVIRLYLCSITGLGMVFDGVGSRVGKRIYLRFRKGISDKANMNLTVIRFHLCVSAFICVR